MGFGSLLLKLVLDVGDFHLEKLIFEVLMFQVVNFLVNIVKLFALSDYKFLETSRLFDADMAWFLILQGRNQVLLLLESRFESFEFFIFDFHKLVELL